jgi:hypothetical protein
LAHTNSPTWVNWLLIRREPILPPPYLMDYQLIHFSFLPILSDWSCSSAIKLLKHSFVNELPSTLLISYLMWVLTDASFFEELIFENFPNDNVLGSVIRHIWNRPLCSKPSPIQKRYTSPIRLFWSSDSPLGSPLLILLGLWG